MVFPIISNHPFFVAHNSLVSGRVPLLGRRLYALRWPFRGFPEKIIRQSFGGAFPSRTIRPKTRKGSPPNHHFSGVVLVLRSVDSKVVFFLSFPGNPRTVFLLDLSHLLSVCKVKVLFQWNHEFGFVEGDCLLYYDCKNHHETAIWANICFFFTFQASNKQIQVRRQKKTLQWKCCELRGDIANSKWFNLHQATKRLAQKDSNLCHFRREKVGHFLPVRLQLEMLPCFRGKNHLYFPQCPYCWVEYYWVG